MQKCSHTEEQKNDPGPPSRRLDTGYELRCARSFYMKFELFSRCVHLVFVLNFSMVTWPCV